MRDADQGVEVVVEVGVHTSFQGFQLQYPAPSEPALSELRHRWNDISTDGNGISTAWYGISSATLKTVRYHINTVALYTNA